MLQLHSMGLSVRMHYMSSRNTENKLQLTSVKFQINKNKRFPKARLCFSVTGNSTSATIVWYNIMRATYPACMQKLKFLLNQRIRGTGIVGAHFRHSVNPYYSQF